MTNLSKIRERALQAIDAGRFEMTPGGVLFPELGLKYAGHFETSVNGSPWEIDPNIVTNEGILDLLTVYWKQGTQQVAWYVALFSGNYTPVGGLTAATFPAAATEFTNYDESTRVLWAPDVAASNAIGNNTTPSLFTISAGGPYTIRGAALVSQATKSSTSGKCPAASRFAADKTLSTGEELRVKYVFGGSSA